MRYSSVVDETHAELREAMHCAVNNLAGEQVAHVAVFCVGSHAAYHVAWVDVCDFAALARGFELGRQHVLEQGPVVGNDDVAPCIASVKKVKELSASTKINSNARHLHRAPHATSLQSAAGAGICGEPQERSRVRLRIYWSSPQPAV